MRFVLLVLLIACGSPSDPLPAIDASVDAGPLDLSTASWDNTPIGVRPETTALRPDLAITASGEVVVIWTDVVEIGADNAPVLAASSERGFAEEQVSPAGAGEFNRPSISASGDVIHAVFSGDGGSTNEDIFYSRRDAGSWSAPVNISAPLDAANLNDADPTVVEVGETTTAVFVGRDPDTFVGGLFAISFSDPSSPGPIETLLDPADFNCSEVEAVTDGSSIHVVAKCTETGGSSALYYLNNRGGPFVRQTVDLGSSTGPLTPAIALDADLGVHLLWVGSVECPSGTCRDVFHSRGLAPPASVTGQSEDGGFMPVLGVDDLGRVIVAFHRLGSVDDVLWTYAEAGGGFVRTQLATPGTDDTTDWQPGAIEINPITGRPHMAFLRSVTGNSDIVHGELR